MAAAWWRGESVLEKKVFFFFGFDDKRERGNGERKTNRRINRREKITPLGPFVSNEGTFVIFKKMGESHQ